MLRPLYVSTVDSGNFIGYLMAVEYALREYSRKPPVDIGVALGLKELLELFNGELAEGTEPISVIKLEQAIAGKKLEEAGWREDTGGNTPFPGGNRPKAKSKKTLLGEKSLWSAGRPAR